jgi:hypothetical protein
MTVWIIAMKNRTVQVSSISNFIANLNKTVIFHLQNQLAAQTSFNVNLVVAYHSTLDVIKKMIVVIIPMNLNVEM